MTTIDTTASHWRLLSAAAAALLFGAAHDVVVRTVPNLVSAIDAVAGLGLNALDANLGSAVFCGGPVFSGCWYCWRQGWIGGDDVKLLSACAVLVPPAAVPELVLTTAIASGALALFYLGLARLLPRDATPQSIGRRPTGLIERI
jgi:prepilin peptidase CpaA